MIWIVRIIGALVTLGWTIAIVKGLRAWNSKKWVLGPDAPAGTEDTLVSIIVPARNEEGSIDACIETARNQDHPSLEIIVLDDASTDMTPNIVSKHAEQDSRVLALTGEGKPLPDGWFGKPWALERAQAHGKGEWLAFIDADVQLSESDSRALAYVESQGLDMLTGVVDELYTHLGACASACCGRAHSGRQLSFAVNNPELKDKISPTVNSSLFQELPTIDGRHASVRQNI